MITESIFNGLTVVIPLADVQHIEKHFEAIYGTKLGCTVRNGTDYEKLKGIQVITSKTTWSFENDCWENPIWVGAEDNQAQEFLMAWCKYRHESEHLATQAGEVEHG